MIGALVLLGCGRAIPAPPPPPDDPWPAWERALTEVVRPSGRVDYAALMERRAALDAVLGELARAPDPPLVGEDLLARRLNAYNAFVLAGVLEAWPLASVKDLRVGIWRVPAGAGFFKGLRFTLDGEAVDLYTLEHRLIRAPFGDARVHAALNCASASCPPLPAEVFEARDLDARLDAAWARFLARAVVVEGDTLALNAIFSWFEEDFLQWRGEPDLCAALARDLDGLPGGPCKLRFMPYDWSLNAAEAPAPLATTPLPWGPPDAGACPPGMVAIAAGRYTTGMKPPLPYGVVDTTTMDVVDAPERGCEAAIAGTPGATACWVQTDLHDPVLPLHEVEVDAYCVEARPFPGEGPYLPDGMSTWDARAFDEALSSGRFGPRRLCTFTELELAVAGPTRNLRFIYGDEADPARCAGGEDLPIGGHPRCENPETGLRDYGAVISQWVVADADFLANACDRPGCTAAGGRALLRADGSPALRYVVAGGTRRVQTRQAPYTPHTWHDHGEPGPEGCDDWGWDDGPAVCADPDPRYLRCPDDPAGQGCAELALAEARWAALLARCRGATMTACLDAALSEVHGERVQVCPGGGGAAGPGQGR